MKKTVIPFLANKEMHGKMRVLFSGFEIELLSEMICCSFSVLRNVGKYRANSAKLNAVLRIEATRHTKKQLSPAEQILQHVIIVS